MPRVENAGIVLDVDEEGVDVQWDDHDFRLRRQVIEGATGKDYRDVTDHDVYRMIEAEPDVDAAPVRFGDLV